MYFDKAQHVGRHSS